jgi:hypothetical protein
VAGHYQRPQPSGSSARALSGRAEPCESSHLIEEGEQMSFSLSLGYSALLFLSTVLVMTTIFITAFVYLKDKSSIFWKRTDYIYFEMTVLGGLLGFIDLQLKEFQRDGQNIRIESSYRLTQLLDGLTTTTEICKKISDYKSNLNSLNLERQKGVFRNQDTELEIDPIVIQIERNFYNKSECRLAHIIDLWIKGKPRIVNLPTRLPGGLMTESLFVFGSDRPTLDNFREGTMPIEIRDALSFKGIGVRPFDISIHESLKRIIELSNAKNALEQSIHQLHPIEPLRSLWPLMLGIGLAIRIARIHAEIKKEIVR